MLTLIGALFTVAAAAAFVDGDCNDTLRPACFPFPSFGTRGAADFIVRYWRYRSSITALRGWGYVQYALEAR